MSMATEAASDVIPSDRLELELPITLIEARRGWRLVDWRELVEYRDLFWFLVLRDVKVRYAQSILGIGWAVIQPVFSMLVFTIVFGYLSRVASDGVPYSLFSFSGLVPWTYFANALTEGVNSLVNNANMISKVYFPRVILPLSSLGAKLIDFGIAVLVLFGMMAWHGRIPNWGVLMLPHLTLVMMLTAAGLAMWLSALAIQYRDVKYSLSFMMQLLMYAAPVVYPASAVPARFQMIYAMNPLVGVIEGFRAALLGTRAMPWEFIAIGSVTAIALAITGLLYFRARERVFADVA